MVKMNHPITLHSISLDRKAIAKKFILTVILVLLRSDLQSIQSGVLRVYFYTIFLLTSLISVFHLISLCHVPLVED